MNVVTLRQGRLASLESFSKGCQALGSTAPEGPQDSVAILGVRDGMVRMVDCDGSDNLQLHLEQGKDGQTTLLIHNPGNQDDPMVGISLGVNVPADERWFSLATSNIGGGVNQISVRPIEGGAEVEIASADTGQWIFSGEGVQEPVFGECASIRVADDWRAAAREALA